MTDTPLPAYLLGAKRLGRAFTKAEELEFRKLLLAHGFQAARNAGLAFGRRLTQNNAMAEDLVQRAFLRMVYLGWDPAEAPLKERLLRLVWSEFTHWSSESRRERKAQSRFVQELRVGARVGVDPAHYAREGETPQDRVEQVQDQLDDDAHAKAQLGKLRALFTKKKDNVNLLWLDFAEKGVSDLAVMALQSGRKVEDFYAAAKRRKRAVQRLAAEARGVSYDDGEDEGS